MSALACEVVPHLGNAGACTANFGRGVARVGFKVERERTALAELYQKDPLRVMFPRVGAAELPTAVLVTTSGGLVGGDSLCVTGSVGVGARAMITTQAAEKVYRSTGTAVGIDCELGVAAGGWLEWLPQETILFDRARLRRRTRVDVQEAGRFLGGEIVVFGRAAHGERLREGWLLDRWDVRVGGRLAWVDALRLDGDIQALLRKTAGFGGAQVLGTIVYVAADADRYLESARAALPGSKGLRTAATCIGNVLIVRFLGAEAFELRRAYGSFWKAFRSEVTGLPARLPRLWEI